LLCNRFNVAQKTANKWGESKSKKEAEGFINDGIQKNASNADSERSEWTEGKRETTGSTEQKERIKSFDGAAGWENFPTQSPICGGDDGLPDRLDNITFPKWRNESIKAYGNAVVPQLIMPIFQTIEKLHREKP